MGLRAALRQDPDVIMIGEMRDTETIDIALKTAETGHLVLTTAHTTDAPKTVHRITSAFPLAEQAMIRMRLSEAIRGILGRHRTRFDHRRHPPERLHLELEVRRA